MNIFRNEIRARESIIAGIKKKLDADILNSTTSEEKRIAIANKRKYLLIFLVLLIEYDTI